MDAVIIAGALIAAFLVFGYHCPFMTFYRIPCPGCGMTRALIFLLKGDLTNSLRFHAMLIPSIAAACLLLIFRKRQRAIRAIAWIWAGSMIAYYIYRVIRGFPW